MAAVGAVLLLTIITTAGKAIATADGAPKPAHHAISTAVEAQNPRADAHRPFEARAATDEAQPRQAAATASPSGDVLTPLPSSDQPASQTCSGGPALTGSGNDAAVPGGLHGALVRAIDSLDKSA